MFSTSMLKRLKTIAEQFDDLIACLLLQETMLVDEGIHHITMRDQHDTVSFCPKGKQQEVNENGEWVYKGRQTMRIGRMVRAIIRPDIKLADKDIELFVNRIYSTTENEPIHQFELVSGKDIAVCYNEENYIGFAGFDSSGDGEYEFEGELSSLCASGASLFQSCMRYKSHSGYLKLYTENPDKIKMLVLRYANNGAVMGRALVWLLDNGRTFMDRIYVCHDRYIETFKQYAHSKKWLYKSKQQTGSLYIVDPKIWSFLNGGEYAKAFQMTVSGIKTDFLHCPYLDTLVYSDRSENGFISTHLVSDKITRHLDCTNGECTPMDLGTCCVSGVVCDKDSLITVQYGKFIGRLARERHLVMAKHYGQLDMPSRNYVMCPISEATVDFEGNWGLNDFLVKDDAGRYGPEKMLNILMDGRKLFDYGDEILNLENLASGYLYDMYKRHGHVQTNSNIPF